MGYDRRQNIYIKEEEEERSRSRWRWREVAEARGGGRRGGGGFKHACVHTIPAAPAIPPAMTSERNVICRSGSFTSRRAAGVRFVPRPQRGFIYKSIRYVRCLAATLS
eukprot:765324-Hanusia_phi.AAC.1